MENEIEIPIRFIDAALEICDEKGLSLDELVTEAIIKFLERGKKLGN